MSDRTNLVREQVSRDYAMAVGGEASLCCAGSG